MSGKQLQPVPPGPEIRIRKPSVSQPQRTRKHSVFDNPPDITVLPMTEYSRHGHGYELPSHVHRSGEHMHRSGDDAQSVATEDSRTRKVSFIGGPRQRGISVSSLQSSDFGTGTRITRKISASSVMSDYRRQAMRRGDRKISDWIMRKPSRYANTYKLTSDKPFNSAVVRKTIETELEQYLSGLTYEPTQMGSKAKMISDDIKQMVKLHGFGRYKIICTVTLGPNRGQGFRESSRCLWDTESDSYVTVTYNNGSMFVVVTVFAVFHE
ncbi:dynein light chain Tctex-type 5-like [Amphiura filiformis]|uniref:dynein light chain Tctex-type 5-like n=1 Tax=Amphiura filiformis TaxID=82378 RepID=UPI003B217C3C